ncbi:MAG: hypothetical protein IPK81_10090 [Rhodospirillales bacterium]|nr:MAG: hypothetical protein IPK81_10090 [Rhodospirillales bacterium]
MNGDPAVATSALRDAYLLFCMAVMVLPMIALAWWYHTRIGDTPGGRALMEEQERIGTHTTDAADVAGMARGIASGAYGERARRMQIRVYWMVGAWLLANVAAWGVLIWM